MIPTILIGLGVLGLTLFIVLRKPASETKGGLPAILGGYLGLILVLQNFDKISIFFGADETTSHYLGIFGCVLLLLCALIFVVWMEHK